MTIEGSARRDRIVTVAGLLVMAGLAWFHLLHMPAMAMADFGLTFLMWAVMMVAMMLPSAAPMIAMFATLERRRAGRAGLVGTALFGAGYVAIWGGFSAMAAAGEVGLRGAGLLTGAGNRVGPLLGSALLILAGVYQLTPLKYACLARCRSPLGFLLGEWREGRAGAFAMGLRHGLFCVGCCWAVMALLFVGGVMNLAWVAGLAAFVLIEKVVPGGRAVSVAAGAVSLIWGISRLAAALAGA
jgi:predicted metal-binding membrane protein